jgi:hypothetical protein
MRNSLFWLLNLLTNCWILSPIAEFCWHLLNRKSVCWIESRIAEFPPGFLSHIVWYSNKYSGVPAQIMCRTYCVGRHAKSVVDSANGILSLQPDCWIGSPIAELCWTLLNFAEFPDRSHRKSDCWIPCDRMLEFPTPSTSAVEQNIKKRLWKLKNYI